jgi:hypothetical protein
MGQQSYLIYIHVILTNNIVEQYRKITSVERCPINFARISTSPLYCIVFYVQDKKEIYSYSINGQFLAVVKDAAELVYNMSVVMGTDHS